MYLKSIEIQGFKSFANKIIFEFHNGITGIVGPNGSGKSNVADAVRWVLGEQNARQLRGANMQDVIFAGTELRKPQGFAYVAITLDNSDHKLGIEFDEVTVSRRVYRSGESEYLINGTACRLKDINELFYDTGIGKEGYSIIGQGQIDKILSGRPEDRRELFDEAAGIVKFKRRKLIAQKKLETEHQNLVRIDDILSELEKQVEPLEKQAETAKEYLKLKEQLKQLDVNLFFIETENKKRSLTELTSNVKIAEETLEDYKNKYDHLKQKYEEYENIINAAETKIAEFRSALGQEQIRKGHIEGQINVLLEQINTENTNIEHIEHRKTTIHSEIIEKNKQIEEYKEDKEKISLEIEDILKRKNTSEQKWKEFESTSEKLFQKIEALKSDIIETLNQKAGLNAKQQRYEALLEQIQVRRSEVCQKILKYKSDESIQDQQIEREKGKLDDILIAMKSLEHQENEIECEITQTSEEIHRLTKSINEKQQQYHVVTSKLESLKNLSERYEGYGSSIKKVMEVRDRIQGIQGVVADIITTDKQYETAIETALGGTIQNIVTDTEQTAKTLIEYLKKHRFGRATFLPVSSVNSRNVLSQAEIFKEPGVIGLASSLVYADTKYQGLVNYLLGRVVVLDNIDHAISLARKFKYSFRIVTLEGELLNTGGSMTGGAFKNSSNLLGRRREIEELEEKCSILLKQSLEVEKDLKMNESVLQEKQQCLKEVKTQIQKLRIDENTTQLNVSQLVDKKNEIADSYEDLNLENEQLQKQIFEINSASKKVLNEIENYDEENKNSNCEIERLNVEYNCAKEQKEKLSSEYSKTQVEASNLLQKKTFIDENIGRIREELQKFDTELSSLTSDADQAYLVIDGKKNEIETLKKEKETLTQLHEKTEQELNVSVKEKEENTASQKQIFQQRENLSSEISKMDKEIFRLQSQKEKLNEQMEAYINYMWDEYELTYSNAEALRKEDITDVSVVKTSIDTLKSEIKLLGNVNVNAIEDYKELSERYEFMKTQHDDLVAAEKTLSDIILELDEGMRKQFEEKFLEIQREFDKVFREMFGGGHGELKLVEEEDLLTAGIQIISQPPGKKLQNMMQLSGGEKALTAIALLFAIQNLKPSPFCLLDEIEAALDDSNVGRFANYLHKLTKYTQFIVVTHRRGTMMASDRLYGITMQEKGVSALVSVNLIEDELDK